MLLPGGFTGNSPHEINELPAQPLLWCLFGVSGMAGILCIHETAHLVCHTPLPQADQHAIVFVMLEVDIWFFRFYKQVMSGFEAMFADFDIQNQVFGPLW